MVKGKTKHILIILSVFWLPQSKFDKFYFFLFIFSERGEGKEKEGKKHGCVRETSISCLSCASNWGTWPAT